MDTKEFKIKLIEADLNNAEFAKLTGLNPKSITNWNQEGKKPPEWVEPFLEFYIKAKKYDELIQGKLTKINEKEQ